MNPAPCPTSPQAEPSLPTSADEPLLRWQEGGVEHVARWRSEAGLPPPRRVEVVDATLKADVAYRLACSGTAMLWRGDFHNARQLLQAIARRCDEMGGKAGDKARGKAARAAPVFPEAFNLHRMRQAQRARVLGQLLIPCEAGHRIPLRRAPDIVQAATEAYGSADAAYVLSLRELQGVIGAHEWRKNGVEIAALGARIHPHYGVFSPVRGEYVDLVAQAPLPAALAETNLAFDIGCGTGVLAAVLARRGVARIIATDQEARALACARDNVDRLGIGGQVELSAADLYPPGRAALVVCNPPWLPGKPSSGLEYAVYDPDSRMLKGFLAGLSAHLLPGGEGWLILSDLAEHLKLRVPDELARLIEAAGLQVVGRLTARPLHPRASDPDDPLHAARAAELTSLWRLAPRPGPAPGP